MKSILVIDDEPMILDSMSVIFEDLGYTVVATADPMNGEKKAIDGEFDLIMVDVRMPVRNGAELTRAILKAKPAARVVIVTAYPNDPLAQEALSAGAIALIAKPFEIGKILELLKD
ncbi:MAG: response regulator [Spirochaetaceae bacterium]|nr:MAG: response regulator [Spirochaetaceae bacterium]